MEGIGTWLLSKVDVGARGGLGRAGNGNQEVSGGQGRSSRAAPVNRSFLRALRNRHLCRAGYLWVRRADTRAEPLPRISWWAGRLSLIGFHDPTQNHSTLNTCCTSFPAVTQAPRVDIQLPARTQSPPLPINGPLEWSSGFGRGSTGGTTTEMVAGSTPHQRSKIL